MLCNRPVAVEEDDAVHWDCLRPNAGPLEDGVKVQTVYVPLGHFDIQCVCLCFVPCQFCSRQKLAENPVHFLVELEGTNGDCVLILFELPCKFLQYKVKLLLFYCKR